MYQEVVTVKHLQTFLPESINFRFRIGTSDKNKVNMQYYLLIFLIPPTQLFFNINGIYYSRVTKPLVDEY